MNANKFILYFRVSTKSQGISGNGIDAQKSTANNFLISQGITGNVESFTEVESGKKSNRTELRKAINRCKETGSTLLIAKLDRLSRDVVFIFTLKEELKKAGVDFLALDLPEANTLTLGMMASFAQHERERIADRTRAGLKSINDTIKKQGYSIGKKSGRRFEKLGNPRMAEISLAGSDASALVRRQKKVNDLGFKQTYEIARLLKDTGFSNDQIATRLNSSGYKTSRGCAFIGAGVSRLLKEGEKLLSNNEKMLSNNEKLLRTAKNC